MYVKHFELKHDNIRFDQRDNIIIKNKRRQFVYVNHQRRNNSLPKSFGRLKHKFSNVFFYVNDILFYTFKK